MDFTKDSNKMNERIKEIITEDKYGEFTPIVQKYLNRALNEYNLSPEFVDLFAKSCKTIEIGSMPKEIEWALGLTVYAEKKIIISNKIYKIAKKEKNDNIYEYVSHILNHEIMHMLLQNIPGIGNALTEAITEVAASRTSFGKDKGKMKEYREETHGYSNITFGANILAAAMGVSEKEFLQLAFEHKIYEKVAKELHSKERANKFLYEINKELEIVRRATLEEKHTDEELKNIQTKAYHAIYIKRKRIFKFKNFKCRNK